MNLQQDNRDGVCSLNDDARIGGGSIENVNFELVRGGAPPFQYPGRGGPDSPQWALGAAPPVLMLPAPFETPPAGLQDAVCTEVIDLGMVESQFGTKRKFKFIWEIDAFKKDGTKFKIAKWYTASLHEKSNLRKDLASWRGRDVTADEQQRFDTNILIGMPCQLELVHVTGRNGNTYANVVRVLPAQVAEGSRS